MDFSGRVGASLTLYNAAMIWAVVILLEWYCDAKRVVRIPALILQIKSNLSWIG